MNYRGHLTGGTITALGVFGVNVSIGTSIGNSLLCSSISLASSLYPDIDTHSEISKITNSICIFGLGILAFTGYYDSFIYLSLLIMPPVFMKHRGLTHNPIYGMVVVGLMIAFMKTIVHINFSLMILMISGYVGYLTHLLLDNKYLRFLKK